MSGTLTPQGAAISKNIAMSIKHKIKYDGSELSRISIAQRAAISCQDLIRNTGEPVGDCHKYLEDAFKAECTDSTKYSKDECGDIIKNGFWQLCQGFRSFYKECKDFKFKSMGGIDTSAGWLWGIGGLLIGGIVAAMVWVLVYCVFLRKKGPKVSKGPSVVQGK